MQTSEHYTLTPTSWRALEVCLEDNQRIASALMLLVLFPSVQCIDTAAAAYEKEGQAFSCGKLSCVCGKTNRMRQYTGGTNKLPYMKYVCTLYHCCLLWMSPMSHECFSGSQKEPRFRIPATDGCFCYRLLFVRALLRLSLPRRATYCL